MKHALEPQDYTDRHELGRGPVHHFELSRRGFMQTLGAGLMVSAVSGTALAQPPGFSPEGHERSLARRLHIGEDGIITVFTSKVEIGQGARTQLAQAAAEELRVSYASIVMIMGDTDLTPDDGGTFGSRTTPVNVPEVRAAATAARELLTAIAAEEWGVEAGQLRVEQGSIHDPSGNRSLSYADLARHARLREGMRERVPETIALTPFEQWRILGTSARKATGRAIVTGALEYPSDLRLPGTWFGRVLRGPHQGATLADVDLNAVQPGERLAVVRDGGFVGCAAPTSREATLAIEQLAKTARWNKTPQPSSDTLDAYFRENQRPTGGGRRGSRTDAEGDVDAAFAACPNLLEATYSIPYIQHVPLEPRAALAVWEDGKLTVWTGSQRPDGVRSELAQAFSLPTSRVRVIISDTGGGFGGKHTGECAVEAARIAQAAKRPVSLTWTREEEFRWAYCRPAALMDLRAALSPENRVCAWEFTNFNAGSAGIGAPYAIPNKRIRYVPTESPLRQGSYRALAAAANNFARECFVDELARAAGQDPLAFRLAHMENERIRRVLQEAAKQFGWEERAANPQPGTGIGIACGTEKNSCLATCALVRVGEEQRDYQVLEICQAFECGKVHNPLNCRAQVEGCIIMGLGAVLSEEMRFENGRITTASLRNYRVPQLRDLPKLDIVLVDRPEIPSAGASETPIIGVAPAIGNAIFAATGKRLRKLPFRLDA